MTPLMLKSRPFSIIITLCLIAVIGIIDYITGIELNFFVFYYIPISIAAWYIDKKWAIINSVLSALTWTSIDIISQHNYSHWSLFFWNGGIRFISYITLAVGLFLIRKLLEVEKDLTRSLQITLEEIKMLKGFLPICASCKNIRNDRGYWEKIEQYISSHSEAEFTHTLCPDCVKKLYPDIDTSQDK
jgi:hypothetical protein